MQTQTFDPPDFILARPAISAVNPTIVLYAADFVAPPLVDSALTIDEANLVKRPPGASINLPVVVDSADLLPAPKYSSVVLYSSELT